MFMSHIDGKHCRKFEETSAPVSLSLCEAAIVGF